MYRVILGTMHLTTFYRAICNTTTAMPLIWVSYIPFLGIMYPATPLLRLLARYISLGFVYPLFFHMGIMYHDPARFTGCCAPHYIIENYVSR